jgi:hypothetical protein
MMIKVILTAGLLILFLYAAFQHSRSRLMATIMMIAAAAGEIFVVAPDLSNDLARVLGVSRGADLLFYCFIAAAMSAIFNLHLRIQSVSEITTELARTIAVMSAAKPSGATLPDQAACLDRVAS